MRLAGNTGRKNRHLGTIAQLCRAMSSQLRHVSTIRKNLLNSNTFSRCADNMVNLGLLATEICWRVWQPSRWALAYISRINLLFDGSPIRLYYEKLQIWANAQRDSRPAEYMWRPLFNAAKFG